MPSPSAYAVGAIVGTGGMGIVYEARHPTIAAPLVIKVLRPELSNNPGVRFRFAAEVRALRRLDHPNIARYVDSGDDFLVMERVPGVLLGSLSGSTGLAVARVLAIIDQLLHALAHVHARGVVHADVKCDNLLVDTTTGVDRLTLIDFGVARIIDEAPDAEPVMSGTPEYMAPEVIRGEPACSAADLYAVGVVFYELLTGTTPFGGGSSDTVLLRHLNEDVVPPSLRAPNRSIPPAIERIVMRALSKDPAARFTSAGTFAVAIQDATRGIRDVAELAAADVLQTAFSTEAPTRDWSSDDVPAVLRPHRVSRGAPPTRSGSIERARRRIGDAIILGDTCEIAAGYLELARLLVNERRLTAAVAELEEAIDVLSSPGTERHSRLLLWPVLLALAALHDGLGDRRRASSVARLAHESAACAGSSLGVSRATALLARLEPNGPVAAQPGCGSAQRILRVGSSSR